MGFFDAVASIFGARRDRKNQIADRNFEVEYNDPRNIRARAEAAGINPVLFFGPGSGTYSGPGFQPVFSQAYARAGAAIDDALLSVVSGKPVSSAQMEQGRRRDARVSALETVNSTLARAVVSAAVRPKVPGIYGGSAVPPVNVSALPALAGASGADPYSSPYPVSGTSTRVAYGNDGASTAMPSASDLDEMIPGLVIEGLNRGKAAGLYDKADMDVLEGQGRWFGDRASAWMMAGSRIAAKLADDPNARVKEWPTFKVKVPHAVRQFIPGGVIMLPGAKREDGFAPRASAMFNPWK